MRLARDDSDATAFTVPDSRSAILPRLLDVLVDCGVQAIDERACHLGPLPLEQGEGFLKQFVSLTRQGANCAMSRGGNYQLLAAPFPEVKSGFPHYAFLRQLWKQSSFVRALLCVLRSAECFWL